MQQYHAQGTNYTHSIQNLLHRSQFQTVISQPYSSSIYFFRQHKSFQQIISRCVGILDWVEKSLLTACISLIWKPLTWRLGLQVQYFDCLRLQYIYAWPDPKCHSMTPCTIMKYDSWVDTQYYRSRYRGKYFHQQITTIMPPTMTVLDMLCYQLQTMTPIRNL